MKGVQAGFALLLAMLSAATTAARELDRAMIEGGIHNHMTGESPRIVFLHYFGTGPTEALARGLKAALDAQRH